MYNSQTQLTAQSYPMQSPPNSYNPNSYNPNTMQNPNMPLMRPQPQSYGMQPQPMMMQVQQPMMMQPMGLTTTTVVSASAVAVSSQPTFRGNQNLFCPNCHSPTISNVQFIPGGGAFIVCLGLFMCVGLFSLITFCVDDCKDAHHYCSRCGAHLGEVRFLLD